jgi:glycosyltransferase involved in cell wall biosynthesis
VQPADGVFDVLVVASWFPAYDDPAAGRFVADQAEALVATGIARPAVISFDGIRLTGGATTRGRQAEVVLEAVTAAARDSEPLFSTNALGVDEGLPVARLSIPEGQTPSTGTAHAAAHREAVLMAVADRLRASGSAGGTDIPRGVVHGHTVYPDGAAAAALADRLGWPLVITEHSSFVDRIVARPELRERYAAALGRAQCVLAVSEMLAAELRAAFPEHASSIQVLPNAVPMNRFSAPPLSERKHDELLFVGYRKPTKGIENLLRAIAVAHRQRPSITLRLLGRSPDEATEDGWRALANSLGLAEAVTFDDPIDRGGVAAAMAGASVFVHPSPRETFGVVAVEALASGLPVVATDSGGVTEILGPEPDRLGALVAVDDPEALGAAIVETLERRESFDPAELRASVERRFGSAYVAERLLVVYREALLAPGAGPASAAAWSTLTGRGSGVPPTVVVALDRERAALRLGPLPEELRQSLTLVTATEPTTVALPALGRVIEAAVDTNWRPQTGAPPLTRRPGLVGRLARLATDPVGVLARRLGRGAGSDNSLAPATQAVRETLAGLAGAVEVLPLDGHDHLAMAPLVRDGRARLSRGGLRRLADLWHASRGASGP